MTDADPSDAGLSDAVEDLRYELVDGIARITLNRPEAANSLTPDQRDRLIDLFADASADLRVRVVVLGATGTHFCTGADLRVSRIAETPRPAGAPERVVGDVGRTIKRGAQRLVTSILDCEKPVIAAVNGTAAGIGAHIALACDLIVAADTARFIEVFVRRGITPDGAGAYLLPRMIGLAKAKELVFLGDDLSAADAERIGLINKVVPPDALDKAVDEWAGRLASGPTKAISLSKWLLNRSLDSDRAGALDDEAWAQELASRTEDFAEGVQAFIDRRDVEFRGW
jgi:2-(1,2-epoxy-1,2-dihydrophenyl)acetyl-CoA isomerase